MPRFAPTALALLALIATAAPAHANEGGDMETSTTESPVSFKTNTSKFDPYKNFKFQVKWDGRYVAGVSKLSALKKTTEVVTTDPNDGVGRKLPGNTVFEPISLEEGITCSPEFQPWAEMTWGTGTELRLQIIEQLEDGTTVQVYDGWMLPEASSVGVPDEYGCVDLGYLDMVMVVEDA
jgi:phage tail-like protein